MWLAMDVPEQELDGIFSSISSLYMFGIRGEDKHTYLPFYVFQAQ